MSEIDVSSKAVRGMPTVHALMQYLRLNGHHVIVGTCLDSAHLPWYGHVDAPDLSNEWNRSGRTPLSALKKAALAMIKDCG